MTSLIRAPLVERVAPEPSILRAWDLLCDEVDAGPFARPGWVIAMVDAFGGDLGLAVARDHGRLVAVAPFVGRRRVETPTGWHTPWHEIAAVDDVARRAVWGSVLSSATTVVADHLLGDGADADVVAGLLADAGFMVEVRDRQAPPFIDLHGDWEGFEAAMTSKRRSDLRRRMRRLAETGDVRFEVLDGRHELDVLLDEGFAVEASGWKGSEGTAVAVDAQTDTFYRAVARWAAERGWLRLGFLRLDGRAVGFDFALETGGRHYLLKTGFDEELRRFAPGALLRREMIKRCFEDGVDVYEFTGDVAPWKREWADTTRQTIRFVAFAPSPGGWARWSGRQAARAVGAVRSRWSASADDGEHLS